MVYIEASMSSIHFLQSLKKMSWVSLVCRPIASIVNSHISLNDSIFTIRINAFRISIPYGETLQNLTRIPISHSSLPRWEYSVTVVIKTRMLCILQASIWTMGTIACKTSGLYVIPTRMEICLRSRSLNAAQCISSLFRQGRAYVILNAIINM